MSTDVLTPNHPNMTHEQILSNLMLYKEQYDGEDNLTLNTVPNRLDVCKALGVSRVAPFFNPANLNQKNRFIFFNLENHSILWENLHNKSTKPIDDSTRELVCLLKQAELGGWVLLSRVNEKNRN